MSSSCWLLRDPSDGRQPTMVAQYAQLLGLDCKGWDRSESPYDAHADAQEIVIGLTYRALRSLRGDRALRLRNLIKSGATLFVRGGFPDKPCCSLWPIVDATFSLTRRPKDSIYRIEPAAPMPEVLHGETGRAESLLACAQELPTCAVPLASAQFESGAWFPFLFALECGAGMVICDLQPDAPATSPEQPIIDRLANPSQRHAELGALASVRHAAGFGPARRSALNLIIDDRPANFDFLNTRNLREWLRHVDSQFPGAHIDFAWTPDQLHPARSYIETMKQFNTGVVWHGFKRHINHRESLSLADDLRDGVEMVTQTSRRFGLEFQKIMVFPFETFGLNALPFLERAGFIATFARPLAPVGLWSPFPSFMDGSVPLHEQFTDIFPVLRRHSCESLTQDVMLAHCALSLPIIVVIHPDEIGLRRWPHAPLRQGSRTYCDLLLSFAARKRLQARSLEEIARDAIDRPRPTDPEPGELRRETARPIH